MYYTRVKRRRRFLMVLALVLLILLCLGVVFLILRPATSDAPSSQPTSGQLDNMPVETPERVVVELPDWVTEKLIPLNPYSRPGDPLEQVNGVVIHYVGNPGTTAEQNNSYFENLAITGETYASSHFLIGLEGEIICNVPLDEIAYCTGPRNADTISIECCHPDDTGTFTQATYDSLIKLVRWLMDEYSLDTDQIIRHYDATGKECPLYYVENPEEWEQFLADLEQ